MSPATPWTEMSGPETPYIKGIPTAPPGMMIFGVNLMPTSGLSAFVETPYAKMSVAATASTKMTAPPTTWTEMTG